MIMPRRATRPAYWLVNGKRSIVGSDRLLRQDGTVLESRRKGFVAVFDGFEEFDISTAGASIHGRRGGSGLPLLLLHGIPETWHPRKPHANC